MSLCAHPKFLEKDKLLKEYIEKFNKDLIYKKDIKFIRNKMAFNGKYAYSWPQQGGKKMSNKSGNKGFHKSEIDTIEGKDSDSSHASNYLSQPSGRGRGRSRGSRKRQYG